jgi:hypothetical protein
VTVSYSAAYRLTLPVDGTENGVWGQHVNTNMALLEAAFDGAANVNVTSGSVTLTTVNGGPDQARNRYVYLTGSPTAAAEVTIPGAFRTYLFFNITSQTVRIRTATASAGVVDVPAGARLWVWCDSINVVRVQSGIDGRTPAELAAELPIFSASARGLVPPSPGGTVTFLRADGTWATPPGGGGGGGGDMFRADNLSGLGNVATARANLGLGTAATANIGTTGAVVPLLNGANTHTDARGVAAAATSNLQFGFRRLRPASVTSGTPVAADSDSCIYADGNVTLPASVFAQGDSLLIYNNTGSSITITQGSGLTLRSDGTALTGDRTLAQRGRAAVLYISAAEAVIGGAIT